MVCTEKEREGLGVGCEKAHHGGPETRYVKRLGVLVSGPDKLVVSKKKKKSLLSSSDISKSLIKK